jgi:hypothetical protein
MSVIVRVLDCDQVCRRDVTHAPGLYHPGQEPEQCLPDEAANRDLVAARDKLQSVRPPSSLRLVPDQVLGTGAHAWTVTGRIARECGQRRCESQGKSDAGRVSLGRSPRYRHRRSHSRLLGMSRPAA